MQFIFMEEIIKFKYSNYENKVWMWLPLTLLLDYWIIRHYQIASVFRLSDIVRRRNSAFTEFSSSIMIHSWILFEVTKLPQNRKCSPKFTLHCCLFVALVCNTEQLSWCHNLNSPFSHFLGLNGGSPNLIFAISFTHFQAWKFYTPKNLRQKLLRDIMR